MKRKLYIWLIIFCANLFFINSCQKDDNTDGLKEVDMCPEVAMGNFDEVGMILKDYLNYQSGRSYSEKLESLDKYLNKCKCLNVYKISSEEVKAFPGVMEYKLHFIVNTDTADKVMDLMVFEDGRVEFMKFHE